MTEPIAGTGHNAPPLEVRHAATVARFSELTTAAGNVPAALRDDDDCGKAQDLIKQMRDICTAAEAARKVEGKPFRDGEALVNAFFTKPIEALKKLQGDVKGRVDKFMQEKKAAAERAALELARLERAEADKRMKEAAEAESKKKAAEDAAALALEQEKLAKARRLQEEQLAQEARDRAKAATVQAEKAKAETEAAEAKKRAAAAKDEEDRSRKVRVAATTTAAHADRDADLSMKGAMRAAGRADRMDRNAESPAEMSRTRGDLGTVGSLARRWAVRSVDRDEVSPSSIWPHIATSAIEAAAYRYMQAHIGDEGGPKLRGVVFEQIEEARIK